MLSYNTLRALPSLRSYEEASKWEQATKPIRGREPEIKPLGRRNQTYLTIARDADESIALSYGSAAFLRFRPNGDMLMYDHSYWQKASTNDLILEITGIRVETFAGRSWVQLNGKSMYLRPNVRGKWEKGVYVHPAVYPENIFRRVKAKGVNYEYWTYVNPPTMTKHVLKRKETSLLRARYAPFGQYVEAMFKLLDGTNGDINEYVRVFNIDSATHIPPTPLWWNIRPAVPMPPSDNGFNHTGAAQLTALMVSEDLEDNYKAFLWLTQPRSGPRTINVLKAQIEKAIIMAHWSTVLQRVEAEPTGKTKDRYAWAVPKDAYTA